MFKASSRSDSDAALNVAALKLGEENARRTLVSSSVLDSSLTSDPTVRRLFLGGLSV